MIVALGTSEKDFIIEKVRDSPLVIISFVRLV